MNDKVQIEPYSGPAGGWGSLQSVTRKLGVTRAIGGAAELTRQNKPDGFACVSCAWAKPANPHAAEFCENGAKATFWELTADRATPGFFNRHTLAELRGWSDHDLEMTGRLTQPMRHNPETDKFEPVTWDAAFAEIGREMAALRAVDPKSVVFYASGRASLETSYMWQLLARVYGNNNLPDSSNMCHESTSVGLKESIGSPVGTVTLAHFAETDAIFFFGQNVGSNAPRMLHPLQEAARRGASIVTFNPLRERGLERFTNPQEVSAMLTRSETRISSAYYQLRPAGDIAAITGMCRWLLDNDRIDHAFIAEHCDGFEDFAAFVRAQDWADLERESGLTRAQMEEAAAIYAEAKAAIIAYGMGITQHKLGVQTVQMITNLMLMRGNVGRPGAGICPVRGHSNVQGQRTVGISEKPELVPLDRLAEMYSFEPPRDKGMDTVETCEGIIGGTVQAFLGLGGNFLRAVPETALMEEAWPNMRLSVQVATKLNRGHLFNGRVGYLLPCLGRLEHEIDGRPQLVSIEDGTACIHASIGRRPPASPDLMSEPGIVAGIARAAIPEVTTVPWTTWANDLALVRAAIERTWPDTFPDYERRMHQPGGFRRPIAADERVWKTDTGKAGFKVPPALHASFDPGGDLSIFRLMTLRSNDQFNTTIYGMRDRFRGVTGTRMVVFMNREDMARLGIAEGQDIGMRTVEDDGVTREIGGLRVVGYDMPKGSLGAYYPECNVLIPLRQHAEQSHVLAAKSVPVRVMVGDEVLV